MIYLLAKFINNLEKINENEQGGNQREISWYLEDMFTTSSEEVSIDEVKTLFDLDGNFIFPINKESVEWLIMVCSVRTYRAIYSKLQFLDKITFFNLTLNSDNLSESDIFDFIEEIVNIEKDISILTKEKEILRNSLDEYGDDNLEELYSKFDTRILNMEP